MPPSARLHEDGWLIGKLLDVQKSLVGRAALGQAPRLLAMILVSLELCVVNTEEDDYPRMFAWYRLVRYWAVMRFDDTAAMPPGRLELGARGLRAVLEQTKTTGTDKRVQTLFVTIAWDAWVAAPGWLKAGFDLWAKHSFERDYFLALPAPDLNGLRRAEAEYKDSAAQGRRLLAKHLMVPIRTPAPSTDGGPSAARCSTRR